MSAPGTWNTPRGPNGEPLEKPQPCEACKRLIVRIHADPRHPIEWKGGRNHFLRCAGPDGWGRPKRLMNYCFKHRALFNTKGPGCPPCRAIRQAKKDAKEWHTKPPLEKFA